MHSNFKYITWVPAALAVALACVFPIVKSVDSGFFLTIAGNIARHFCYSGSTVDSGACVPTWGNQPPAYPAFIALIQILGGSERAIVVLQVALYAAAVTYLCWALYLRHKSTALLALSCTLSIFSPAAFGWSRVIQTELLACGAVALVSALIIRSVGKNRPAVGAIAAAVATAMLIRWDLIWLVLPAVMTFWLVERAKIAGRDSAILVTCVALPYVLLMLRAAVVGLPLVPTTVGDQAALPMGIVRFYRAAALDARAQDNLLANLEWGGYWARIANSTPEAAIKERAARVGGYSHVSSTMLDAYWDRIDKKETGALLSELREVPDGQAIPPSLNERFAALAAGISQDWPADQILLPLARARAMWRDWFDYGVIASGIGQTAWAKRIFATYYLVVMAGFALAMIGRDVAIRRCALLLSVFVVTRTLFFVSLPISALDPRYLTPFFPAIDALGLYGLWQMLRLRSPMPAIAKG